MISAVIFDALSAACDEMGMDAAAVLEIVFGPYDDDTDHPWHQVERGELSFADYTTAVQAEARQAGYDFDPMDILVRMSSGGTNGGAIREDMVDAVRHARTTGRSTALLTNNVAEFRNMWRPLMPLEELFDVVVDSSEVGMRKPSAPIFELTLERLGGPSAGETLFLDDAAGNIAGATRVGMRTILVETDHRGALAELLSLLGP
jgi:epoxide hydrolase-like predicted phosphatase